MRLAYQLAWALLILALCSCSYRPVRFADRPAVTEAHDDQPIVKPEQRTFLKELYQADVYVRQELIGGLDPRRSADAVDVNAMDEVVHSSWHRGSVRKAPSAHEPYRRSGPPQAPWRKRTPTEDHNPTVTIVDQRGLNYHWLDDPPGRIGMRAAAAAITSRLLHALGYHTPEVWVVADKAGKLRAAIRWPLGEELGPSMINSERPDDPNDVLPALNRRSLRALRPIAAWLNMTALAPDVFRDVYLGQSPDGHVRHVLVHWDGALGVDAYLNAKEFAEDPDREHKNFFLRLFSMGLSPKPPPIVPRTLWPSIGLLGSYVDIENFSVTPPFAPFDHLQAADEYWAAKQLHDISPTVIAAAIQAGQLPPGPQNWLFQILLLRRAQVIAHGFAQTTPCELQAIRSDGPSTELRISDLAIKQGFVQNENTLYAIKIIDDEGDVTAPPQLLRPERGELTVSLPATLLERPYTVVQITARHGSYLAPRPFEVHLKPKAGRFTVLGLRH